MPVYTEHQRCDDTSDTALTENNGVAPEWCCKPVWSDSIVFKQSSIANVIAALTLIRVKRGLNLNSLEPGASGIAPLSLSAK